MSKRLPKITKFLKLSNLTTNCTSDIIFSVVRKISISTANLSTKVFINPLAFTNTFY